MKAVLVMALLIVLGVFGICKPDVCWAWQHRHAEKAGEPPRWYLISTRISGAVMCAIGLLILVLLLFR